MAARTTHEDGATVEEGLRDTVAGTVPIHDDHVRIPGTPGLDPVYSGLAECLIRFLKLYFALHVGLSGQMRLELISRLKNDHIYSLDDLTECFQYGLLTNYPVLFVAKVSVEFSRKVEAHGLVRKRKLDIEEEYEKVTKMSKGFTVIHNGYRKEIPGVQMKKRVVELSLLFLAFGEFFDNVNSITPSPSIWSLVSNLSKGVLKKWSSYLMARLFLEYMDLQCEFKFEPRIEDGTSSRCVAGAFYQSDILVCMIVVKEHDALDEGLAFYRASLLCGGLNPKQQYVCRRSSCPCFLVEICGPQIRISGIVHLEEVICESFTHLLNLGFGKDSMHPKLLHDVGCSLAALKLGINSLLSMYTSLAIADSVV